MLNTTNHHPTDSPWLWAGALLIKCKQVVDNLSVSTESVMWFLPRGIGNFPNKISTPGEWVTQPSGRFGARNGKGSVLEVGSISATQKQPAWTTTDNRGRMAQRKVILDSPQRVRKYPSRAS